LCFFDISTGECCYEADDSGEQYHWSGDAVYTHKVFYIEVADNWDACDGNSFGLLDELHGCHIGHAGHISIEFNIDEACDDKLYEG